MGSPHFYRQSKGSKIGNICSFNFKVTLTIQEKILSCRNRSFLDDEFLKGEGNPT